MHNTYKRRILKGQAGLLAPIQNGGSSFSPLPPMPPINTLNPSGGRSRNGIFSKSNIGSTVNVASQVADVVRSFMPENNAYQGPKGSITRGIDSAYDAAANMAMQINPVIGGAMKVGGLVSDGINAITGGTDGMTTQDSIFSSTLGNLTGLGIINSAFGKRANTINKDNETWEQQGSAYGGSLAKVDDALTKSGKKYGLFSNRARKKANAQISEAKRQQNLVADINEEAQDAFTASNYSGIGLRNQIALNGGYRSMAIGRNGIKILDKELQWANSILNKTKTKDVDKLQKGGKVDGITGAAPKVTFESWYKTVPSDRNDTTSYNLRRAFELAPFDELEAWRTSSVKDLKNGKNHLNSVYLNPKTGIYEFMKAKDHPTLKYELEWYNSKDPEAVRFRNSYDLDTSEDYYKYVPKKFAEGGKVNVIPEGALHKNKHHLEDINPEFKDVTNKGIPVVSKEDGGELVQHAEIERNEIIFNLDVTNKLEELMKKGDDESAIEAGKLLVHEILNNTIDNTGILKEIQ